jgi:hypothetical protein
MVLLLSTWLVELTIKLVLAVEVVNDWADVEAQDINIKTEKKSR